MGGGAGKGGWGGVVSVAHVNVQAFALLVR